MRYGCIGERLTHSFSGEIHAMIGRCEYELRELSREEFPRFMRERGFMGINVTIPYKREVIPYLDHIDETAAAAGSVNTIVNRGKELHGYNTDYGGMKAMAERMGADAAGKKVLICGTGGTARTALRLMLDSGAREAHLLSRTARGGGISYDEAYRLHRDADIIINATPAGMFPDILGMPLDLTGFTMLSAVMDAVYNPLSTRLVLTAQRMGIPACSGLYMLVSQAVLAAELFTGEPMAGSLSEDIYGRLCLSRRNIVLIGMPMSGKSTAGAMIASSLGREFIDTDELIRRRCNMEIPDIFSRFGEARFRELERDAVMQAALRTGVVTATGGGAILDERNVEALRMNGTLYFLDRPPEALRPDESRPLADTQQKLDRLYRERRSLYLRAADVHIPPELGLQQAASMIESRHTA